MWNYERRLQYPVNITRCNPQAAQIIISQYGGPDGEMGAAMRYLSQRYSMKDRTVMGTLTDIGVSVRKLRMGFSDTLLKPSALSFFFYFPARASFII